MAFSLPKTSPGPLRAVFLSSFVPRECGIATFTEDVLNAVTAHGIHCRVIAMNRPGQTAAYDRRVLMTIDEAKLDAYLAAAMAINRGGFDVLSIQHEYGIFGGAECHYLNALLDAVEIPIITTFHTILRTPTPTQRASLRAIADRSQGIVVMNSLAIEMLGTIYGVDTRKAVMIHHGAPVVAQERRPTIKGDLNLQGKQIIATFGLLSAGKGLEYAIQAMPRIVAEHPQAHYLILGQTHPVVKQEEGERYRESLKTLARELGVHEHVRFIDKYFTKAELVAYLQATDIYLTPYPNLEQITSGTLAYAMACGRPLVSTPYLYAEFLLGDDRGLLVPPRDPDAIADACLRICNDPALKARLERTNWRYGQSLIWPRVGYEYLQFFRQLVDQHSLRPAAMVPRMAGGARGEDVSPMRRKSA